ncbi:hypothetical protein ENBRE01_1426, partial [Enteropsectra breve]
MTRFYVLSAAFELLSLLAPCAASQAEYYTKLCKKTDSLQRCEKALSFLVASTQLASQIEKYECPEDKTMHYLLKQVLAHRTSKGNMHCSALEDFHEEITSRSIGIDTTNMGNLVLVIASLIDYERNLSEKLFAINFMLKVLETDSNELVDESVSSLYSAMNGNYSECFDTINTADLITNTVEKDSRCQHAIERINSKLLPSHKVQSKIMLSKYVLFNCFVPARKARNDKNFNSSFSYSQEDEFGELQDFKYTMKSVIFIKTPNSARSAAEYEMLQFQDESAIPEAMEQLFESGE